MYAYASPAPNASATKHSHRVQRRRLHLDQHLPNLRLRDRPIFMKAKGFLRRPAPLDDPRALRCGEGGFACGIGIGGSVFVAHDGCSVNRSFRRRQGTEASGVVDRRKLAEKMEVRDKSDTAEHLATLKVPSDGLCCYHDASRLRVGGLELRRRGTQVRRTTVKRATRGWPWTVDATIVEAGLPSIEASPRASRTRPRSLTLRVTRSAIRRPEPCEFTGSSIRKALLFVPDVRGDARAPANA